MVYPAFRHHGGKDEYGDFPYIRAARQLANEENVVLFDLFEKSKLLYEMLGEKDAEYLQSIKDENGQTIGEANYNRPVNWDEYDKEVFNPSLNIGKFSTFKKEIPLTETSARNLFSILPISPISL